ncbi:coenzyme F420-0:L-glutamate ligase [Actinotalea sp. JY-7885]|uniref:coenzyme F420-0:L-glutamate ligase n=1 Tax=Actinotalea sp. JY-7885 TaxID=2758576 RepID=UPI00165D8AA2|nr:coenzyme F420-0:L-glutamate ligase [Actinotalea sp. JY-7885]
MSAPPALSAVAPGGVPEVRPGDDLAALVLGAADAAVWPDGSTGLRDGDVVVVTSKVVSKAEGRVLAAADREGAITQETVRLVASRRHPGGVLRIVENRLGLVMAAAGVDASNTPEGTVLLLPIDPDASARALRARLQAATGRRLGVVVTDTAGRAWRRGLVDLAIGAAGVVVLEDLRGSADHHGRTLDVTVRAVADEIASAAELLTGKTSQRPVTVVRGLGHHVLPPDDDGAGAGSVVRPAAEDLFREGSAEAYARGYAAGLAAARDTAGGVSAGGVSGSAPRP